MGTRGLSGRLRAAHVPASPGASALPVSKWPAADLAFAHEAARGLPPFAEHVALIRLRTIWVVRGLPRKETSIAGQSRRS